MNRRSFLSAAIAFAAAAVAGVPKVFGRKHGTSHKEWQAATDAFEMPLDERLADHFGKRRFKVKATMHGVGRSGAKPMEMFVEECTGPAVYLNHDGTVTTTPDDSKVCIGIVVEYDPSTKVATVRL